MNQYVLDNLLLPVVFLFFVVSGLFGFCLGIALLACRERALRLFGPVNRWVSARRNLHPMEAPHDIEPFVHRHRRAFAAFFIAGGLLSLGVLLFRVDADAVAAAAGGGRFSFIEPWIARSVKYLLVLGSLLAVVVGSALAAGAPALGQWEQHANRWISSRQIMRGVDSMHVPLDRWFESSPRAAGAVLAVASAAMTAGSAIMLLAHR